MKWLNNVALKRLNERRWLVLLALTALVALLYIAWAGWGFPLDDSWIHQTYGRNLGLLGEWALIPGQPSAASTAPFYTVLLAIGYVLRLPFILWTHLLGALALWLTALFGARLADRIAPELRYAGLFAGMGIVLAWHLIWAAVSGMETALFGMWTLLLPLLIWREFDEGRSQSPHATFLRGLVFGGASALAMLTRPEGIVAAGLCGLAYLYVVALRRLQIRPVVLWIAAAAVGFALLIGPYWAFNFQITGGLLPSTAAPKQAQLEPVFEFSLLHRIWLMVRPLSAGGQLLLLPGIVMFVMVMARRLRGNAPLAPGLVPAVWALALIVLYAARLPAYFQHGRYVIPSVPSLVLIGVIGTLWLLKRGRPSLLGRVLSRSIAVAAVVMFVATGFFVGPVALERDVTIINEEMVTSAHWLAANIPPEDFLVLHDIGAVAYFTPRPILDIGGLVSPEVVSIINDGDELWALMQERDAEYLLAFPNQIPGRDVTDPRLCEVFNTQGQESIEAGYGNMAVYALAWDGSC